MKLERMAILLIGAEGETTAASSRERQTASNAGRSSPPKTVLPSGARIAGTMRRSSPHVRSRFSGTSRGTRRNRYSEHLTALRSLASCLQRWMGRSIRKPLVRVTEDHPTPAESEQ